MSKITRRVLIKNTGLGLGTIAAASLIGVFSFRFLSIK